MRHLVVRSIVAAGALTVLPVASLPAISPAGARPPAAATSTCARVAVPAYFLPGPLWETAIGSASSVSYLVMNPGTGPGLARDEAYAATVRKAQATGISVLGYVDTDYGRREPALVRQDVAAFDEWYGVDGIFLDQVSSGADGLGYYASLAEFIRTTPGPLVALNPGTFPVEGYAALADVLVTFEGSYASYRSLASPDWVKKYPASRFWHLVYATTSADMPTAVKLARQRSAGHLYVTDDVLPNPWDTLPPYWSSELRRAC